MRKIKGKLHYKSARGIGRGCKPWASVIPIECSRLFFAVSVFAAACSPPNFNNDQNFRSGGSGAINPIDIKFLQTMPVSPTKIQVAPRIVGQVVGLVEKIEFFSDSACTQFIGQGSATEFTSIAGAQIFVAWNSTTPIYGKGTNSLGQQTLCKLMTRYMQKSTPPAAPALVSVSPVSPSASLNPSLTGTVSSDAVSLQFFSDSSCTQQIGSGSAALFQSTGLAVNLNPNATTPIYAEAVDVVSNVSTCTLLTTYTQSSAAPVTQIAFSTQPSSSGIAGTALSTQPSVSLEDSGGTTVTGSSASVSLNLYTDAGCTTAASGGTFTVGNNPVNASSGVASFSGVKYTLAGTYYLGADSAGLTRACSSAITITAAAAASITKIAGDAQAAQVATSVATSPKVQVKDAYGNLVSGATVSWSVTAGGTGAAISPATSVTDSNGYALAGTWTLGQNAGSANNSLNAAVGAVAATFTASATPGPPAKLMLSMAGGTSVVVQTCSAVTLQSVDIYGNASAVSSDVTVNLSSTSSGTGIYYSSTACGSTTTSAVISSGTSSQTLYYKDFIMESISLGAQDQSGTLAAASALNVNEQAKFNLAGATTAAAGTCVAYAIGLVDALGNTLTAPVNIAAISSSNPSSANSYSDSGCGTLSSTSMINSGQSSTTMYFSDTRAEGYFTAISSSSSLISGYTPLNITFTASTAASVIVDGPSIVAPGTCSEPFIVRSIDAYGNSANVGSPVSVSLSQGGSAAFYSDSSCSTGTASVTIGSGSNNARFYVMDSAAEPVTLSADGTPTLTSAAFNFHVQSSTSFTAVALGGSHGCAVVDGGVSCWGQNNSGQLGNGTMTSSSAPVQAIAPGSGVTAVSAGTAHTCAIIAGALKCWGYNYNSQLGIASTDPCVDGTTKCVLSPHTVIPSGVTNVAAAAQTTCAIVNGGVQCWGYNGYGNAGSGNFNAITAPNDVVGLGAGSGVTALSGIADHFCAIQNGGVLCWGYNAFYAVGTGTTANQNAPYQVYASGSGASQVAAGVFHSCALFGDGVRCWGDNSVGEVGVGAAGGTYIKTPPLTSITGLSNVISITPTYEGTCALSSTQGLNCWGQGSSGQLGNGTVTIAYTPTPVTSVTNASFTSVGPSAQPYGDVGYGTCGIAGGNVVCWGSGAAEMLGNGILDTLTTPAPILSFY